MRLPRILVGIADRLFRFLQHWNDSLGLFFPEDGVDLRDVREMKAASSGVTGGDAESELGVLLFDLLVVLDGVNRIVWSIVAALIDTVLLPEALTSVTGTKRQEIAFT